MTQFTELLPATRSERAGALVWRAATDAESADSPFAGVLTLTGRRTHCRYAVEEFPADRGRGFMLFKLDAGSDKTEERYGVCVGPRGTSLCECRGFISQGRCKHIAGLAALIDAGEL